MDDQLKQILSEQLRDVHLPEAVSWWPLAIGWWILGFLAIIAIAVLAYIVLRRIKKNRYRALAKTELMACLSRWKKDQDTAVYLQSVNSVLKRTIMKNNPHSRLLNLTGKHWVKGLNQTGPMKLSDETQTALAQACYQENPQTDVEHVNSNIKQWLSSHKAELIEEGRHA